MNLHYGSPQIAIGIAFGVLAVLLAVRLAQPYDARHPQVGFVAYETDQDAGRGWRLSLAGGPPWTTAVLKTGNAAIAEGSRWWTRARLSVAPAPAIARPSPLITLTPQTDGTLRLSAAAPQGARMLTLRLSPSVPTVLEQLDGAPAKVVRHLKDKERAMIDGGWPIYVEYSRKYMREQAER